MPNTPPKRRLLRLSLIALLVLTCLGMARLQLWRAETRGERFEREQAALASIPIKLSAQQREREKLLNRAATVRGRWLTEKTIFLDNKIYRSRPGYHVLTPLQFSDSRAVVLVNRGWIAAPRLRSDTPSVLSPTGEIEIAGVTRSFETRIFELRKTLPQGAVWQHVRESDYRKSSGLDVLPVILLQTSGGGEGLVRDWGSLENPATRHYGYAAMWAVFALMAAAYGLLAWQKKMTDWQTNSKLADSTPASGATTPYSQKKGRLILLAIVAIGVLPLLAALYFRYVSPPTVKTIVGEPVAPLPLPFEFLQRTDGVALEHPEVSGKWLVIFASPGTCDQRCQHTLYLTRQARTAQGRNMARVERLWLITDASSPAADLLVAHPDLITIKATDEKVFSILGGRESRKINLVDRRGLLVFRYTDDPEPNAFIRELGKLVKF